MTSGAPSICAKSCADRPMRRSGRSRPSWWRIGRLSHGSVRASGGQTPSTRPPSTTRSTCVEARLERAVDAHARARRAGPPHHPVGHGGDEQLGVVRRRDREVGVVVAPRCRRTAGASARAVDAREGRAARRSRPGSNAATTSRCAAASAPNGLRPRRRPCVRAAPARPPAAPPGRRRRPTSASATVARGSLTCISERSPARSLASSRRNVASAWARARPSRRAGAGRAGRRARAPRPPAPARRPDAPSRNSGCLSNGEQRDRRDAVERELGREAREHAGAGIGQRVAARIVDRDVPAPERRQHAARERAVGRHQCGGPALRLDRLAQRHRDRKRLVLRIGGLDHRQSGEPGGQMRGRPRAAGPASGRSRRPAAAPRTAAPRGRAAPARASRTTSGRPMPMRSSSACMANCGWPKAGQAAVSSRGAPRSSPRPRRRGRCRGPAARPRRAADARWWRAAWRSPASSRSSRRRSPVRRPPPASRAASALISRSRRSAGSIACRSARMFGQASRAILRKSSVSCQYDRGAPGPDRRAGSSPPRGSPCRPSAGRDRRRARARPPALRPPAA